MNSVLLQYAVGAADTFVFADEEGVEEDDTVDDEDESRRSVMESDENATRLEERKVVRARAGRLTLQTGNKRRMQKCATIAWYSS